MGKALDLLGKRFGRLTVIEKTHNAKGKLQWHCMCDCGGESFVESNRLLKGITTSCGCLRKERWREAQDKISAEAKNKVKYDIIGKRFDKLTVLSNIEGTDKYECQCDCGACGYGFTGFGLADYAAGGYCVAILGVGVGVLETCSCEGAFCLCLCVAYYVWHGDWLLTR